MDQRLFALPLLLVAVVQLSALVRASPRWFAAQIAQWTVVFLAAAGAWYFREDFKWVPIAWGLFATFVIVPAWLTRRAQRFQVAGVWPSVLRWRRLAGPFVWGQSGQLYRLFTRVLTHLTRLDFDAARQLIGVRAGQPMPEEIDGSVRLMRMHTTSLSEDWKSVIAQYRAASTGWGNAANDRVAAMMTARALAETGAPDAAARIVHDIMARPGRRDETTLSLWHARVACAAVAGDEEELDRLFASPGESADVRGRERLELYWRGRCALACRQPDRAAAYFERVSAQIGADELLWSTALRSARDGVVFVEEPVRERYRLTRDAIRDVESTWARWLDLTQIMCVEFSSLVAVLALVAVFAIEQYWLQPVTREAVWQWLANASDTIVHRQWWRGVTAMLLHLNWEHLAMNACAFWMIGSPLRLVVGRVRMWTVFLLGGAIGNYASAAFNILQTASDRYDMSVGASSGIFSMIGAYAVAVATFRDAAYETVRRRIILLLLLVVASDSMVLMIDPRVDAVAHLGGFCGGLLVSLVWQMWAGNRAPSTSPVINSRTELRASGD